jgi:DNA polymerase-3 subunit delta'
MAWNNIVGQQRAIEIIHRAILESRIAHAYCFWGIEGIGKEALAIEFAKTVNCQNPIVTEHSINACGVCHSCRQADMLQHPNIQIVFPMPSPKSDNSSESIYSKLDDDQVREIQEQLRLKSGNPYHKITISNATQIKIASVREIKRTLNLSPTTQGRRFIIVCRADEMTTEAANSFLKTLEEPHENVTIIMTTSRHNAILPTILSRCQQIHCEPLSDEEVMQTLIERQHLSPADAKIVSAFAQGSYTRALEFLDEDMKSMREKVVAVLRQSLKKKVFRVELLKELDEIFKQKDKKKNETFLMLLLL